MPTKVFDFKICITYYDGRHDSCKEQVILTLLYR